MRTTIVLVLSLALIGCESEFQKCINTELPRAEQLLSNDLKSRLSALQSLATRVEVVAQVERDAILWEIDNEPQSRPNYDDYDSWEEYEPVISAWRETEDAREWEAAQESKYSEMLRAAGFEGETIDELWDSYSDWQNLVADAVRERAVVKDFCGLPCEDPWDAEATETVWDYEEGSIEESLSAFAIFAPKAVAESILMVGEKLNASLVEAEELATLTCNSNGLYE